MITKSDVNGVLKGLGLKNIKLVGEFYGGSDVALRVNGKMVKGIYAYSHSPLDVTDAGRRAVENKLKAVRDALVAAGMTVASESGDVVELTAGKLRLIISVRRYTTHLRSAGLDPDYKTSWICPNWL